LRIKIFAFSFLLFLTVSNLHANPLSAFIARGDSLYNINEYNTSIDAYKKAIAIDSLNAEPQWKLARSLNIVAELEPKEKQMATYELAENAALKCVEDDSMVAEGHFQLARAVGQIALFKGIFKSVALARKVKFEVDKTIALSPNHDGAYHVLGRWHREVAQKPKFARKLLGLGDADKIKGLDYLKKAIELNPTFIHHRLEYGISLLDLDQKELAKAQFEICLQLEAPRPLDLKYQAEAKEYLARLKQKN
jgi:regulator of microtubule dynamics protein 3